MKLIPWHGLLLPLNTPSTDGRTVRLPEGQPLHERDLALPLRAQEANNGTNLGKVKATHLVGIIETIKRTDESIFGTGLIDPGLNPYAEEIAQRLLDGELLPVGVELTGKWVLGGHGSWEVLGATIVETSAFPDAKINLGQIQTRKEETSS